MSGFVDRENQIFETLRAFKDQGLEFIVVGGYAVSAFQHRFSVDADLVIDDRSLGEFTDVLEAQGFEAGEDRALDAYGGRFLAYQQDEELPVTIDLLVGSLRCRQTEAAWSYEYLREHSTEAEIAGSERAIEVRIPERELLVAVKLHSGRLTDARDAVALVEGLDFDRLENHMERGDSEQRRPVLKSVAETIASENFEDAFKGVFRQSRLPEDNIQKLRRFIQNHVE